MVHILLMILKILGIILLVILGLVLLAILLILFVPVRYRCTYSYHDKPRVEATITYLLHALSMRIFYDDGLHYYIRILGIKLPIGDGEGPKVAVDSKQSADKKEDSSQVKQAQDTDGAIAIQEDQETSEASSYKSENASYIKTESGEPIKSAKPDRTVSKTSDSNNNKADNNTESTIDRIRRIIDILNEDSTRSAFAVCKKRVLKLQRLIFPRKSRNRIVYGLDDPFIVSQVLTIYNIFFIYLDRSLTLIPVYGENTIEIDGYFTGHITMAPVLWQVLMVYINKDCRKFIDKFRKE